MLLVPCPNCGPRPAGEMTWHTDRMTAGWVLDRWFCRDGCQQYFQLERNTITDEFRHEQPKTNQEP